MFLETNNKSECCGCMACVYICPTECISVKVDEEGFAYPVKNVKLCVECKKCINVCPNIKIKRTNQPVRNVYAGTCMDSSLVINSSSGGIYPLIAKNIVSNGGVVYAVELTKTFDLQYCRVSDLDGIKRTQGSKYVQCIISKKIINSIDSDLKKNLCVLFVGTPCQVAAIKTLFNKDNLFTIDFVCHGVPSNYLLRKYIESLEIKHLGKVVDLNFRNKDKFGWSITLSYDIMKNKKIKRYYLPHKMSGFFIGFLHGLTLRESCYECNYCSTSRSSDITLCDYWGCKVITPELFNENGVSLILVNSDNGQKLWRDLSKMDVKLSEIALREGLSDSVNKNLSASTIRKDERNNIFSDAEKFGFEYINKRYLKKYVSHKERLIANIPYNIRKKIKALLHLM